MAQLPASKARAARRNTALNVDIGQHMRWVREAYEARNPLQGGLNQWAEALEISRTMLSRVERGEQTASVDVLNRFCYFSGATLDFLFWGLLAPHMDRWLADALRTAHPTRVVEMEDFVSDRAKRRGLRPERLAPRRRHRTVTRDPYLAALPDQ
jgi:transcriptional regulator with XRE-family HTH domain